MLGVPPTKMSATILSAASGQGCENGTWSVICITQFFDGIAESGCFAFPIGFDFLKIYAVLVPPIPEDFDDGPLLRI